MEMSKASGPSIDPVSWRQHWLTLLCHSRTERIRATAKKDLAAELMTRHLSNKFCGFCLGVSSSMQRMVKRDVRMVAWSIGWLALKGGGANAAE
jgi:hypothetical protein